MDPLSKLLPRLGPPRRHLVLLGVGGASALVLTAAVVLSALGSGGSETRVPMSTVRAAPTPTPSTVLVQVTGAVRRPGLVALPNGARALDAVAAAGGATAGADESAVNLAARVIDGQQLVVPRRGVPPTAATAPAPGQGVSATPISLSSATAAQLETLPRIGPAMAARILAWRSAHGGFRAVNDLLQVGGIGPKTLAGLQGLVVP